MRLPWRRELVDLFGWWRFDRPGQRVVRTGTLDSLALERAAGWEDADLRIGNSVNQHWCLYRARLAGASYPLVVESRHLPRSDRAQDRPWVLRLDHVRSARLWQRETGAEGPPPRDLWQRVDAFAIDALHAWPPNERFGPVWDWLAIEGGWLGGQWQERLYRHVQHLCRYPNPHMRFDKSAAAVATAPWRFVPAAEAEDIGEAETALRAIRGRDAEGVEWALARLARTRPHFRTSGAIAMPFAHAGSRAQYRGTGEFWLLADEQLVTDRLQCIRQDAGEAAERWLWDFHTVSPVGTLDRRRGGYARLAGTSMFPIDRDLRGQSFEPITLPASMRAHLRGLAEASMEWIDTALVLPDLEGNRSALHLSRPAESSAKIWFGGGENEWSWLATRLLLDGPSEATAPMAFAFRETNGLIPAGAGPQRIGRFSFDSDMAALADSGHGESLSLEEVSGDAGDGPASMRLRWRGPAGDYPFLVERRHEARRGTRLVIDQDRAAAIWREERGTAGIPDQALWRAAAEGCIAALLHWPDHPRTGRRAPVLSRGGWVNGNWSTSFSRLFEVERHRFGDEARPLLQEPENGLCWRAVGSPNGMSSAHYDPESFAGLGGDLETLIERDPALPALVRDDRRALLAPVRIETRPFREDDVIEEQIWLYADQDVALELRGGRRGIELDNIERPVALQSRGVDLWSRQSYRLAPSPLLSRRLVVALEAYAYLHTQPAHSPMIVLGGRLTGSNEAGLSMRLWV